MIKFQAMSAPASRASTLRERSGRVHKQVAEWELEPLRQAIEQIDDCIQSDNPRKVLPNMFIIIMLYYIILYYVILYHISTLALYKFRFKSLLYNHWPTAHTQSYYIRHRS
jgi:hypothetical protein